MAKDQSQNSEHQKYAQRLAKLEAQSATAFDRRRRYLQKGIGQRVVGIKRDQRANNTKRVLSVLGPFLVVMLVAIYTVSPLSKINQIKVTGNSSLTAQEVMQASQIKKGAWIWRVVDQQAKIQTAARQANPQVKTLRVKLTGLRSVEVKVTEYPIIGLIEHQGKNKLLIGSGRYSEVGDKDIANYIRYAGFERHEKVMRQTAKQLGELPSSIRGGISEVIFAPTTTDNLRLRLFMNDGNEVLVRSDNLKQKMSYYPSISSKMKEKGVIDLQYGAYSYPYDTKSEKSR